MRDLGDARRAIGYYEQALVIPARSATAAGKGMPWATWGVRMQSWATPGGPSATTSRVISREIGDRRGEGNDLGNLRMRAGRRPAGHRREGRECPGQPGECVLQLGEIARRAIGYYEQALVIAREIGDRRGEGKPWATWGLRIADLGDARRAIGYYEQALVIDREIGDLRGVAYRFIQHGPALPAGR